MYPIIIFAILLALTVLVIIIFLQRQKLKNAGSTPIIPKAESVKEINVDDVRAFYNTNTDKFIAVYGDVIQAFRTTQIETYLDYTIVSAELRDGQKILDAGCGIGGPASYFASRLNSEIQGITISDFQVQKSRELLASKQLKGKVSIRQGDYQELSGIYGHDLFDRVLFLESFGHSPDQILLLEEANKVLKPGGILYIKDLFKREHPNEEDGRKIDRITDEINRAYCYHIPDLSTVLAKVRRLNMILLFLRTPEVSIGEFEHLTISNNFQELFDIGRILTWDDYIFPIDFYELKVMKPPFDIAKDKHLYFLNRTDVH